MVCKKSSARGHVIRWLEWRTKECAKQIQGRLAEPETKKSATIRSRKLDQIRFMQGNVEGSLVGLDRQAGDQTGRLSTKAELLGQNGRCGKRDVRWKWCRSLFHSSVELSRTILLKACILFMLAGHVQTLQETEIGMIPFTFRENRSKPEMA